MLAVNEFAKPSLTSIVAIDAVLSESSSAGSGSAPMV